MQSHGGNGLTALLPFVIIAGVLALRFRSMSKERPLNVSTLWIVPVVYLLLVGSMVFTLKPPPMGWGKWSVACGETCCAHSRWTHLRSPSSLASSRFVSH